MAILAAGSLAFTAGRMTPPQAVVAIVDLSKTMNALDEAKDVRADFAAKTQAAQKRVEELNSKLKAEEETFKMLPDGPQKRESAERAARLLVEREAEIKYQDLSLSQLSGDVLREIYSSVDKSAEVIAKKNGYTIVLASDERVEIKRGPYDEVTRTIALKRMLWVDSKHDITDELVVQMNNEYAAKKAGGGKAGAAATPKP